MSWAADDKQVVAVCDGAGWLEHPKNLFNNRLFTVAGGPQNATFRRGRSGQAGLPVSWFGGDCCCCCCRQAPPDVCC
jgi:hypothetical protein